MSADPLLVDGAIVLSVTASIVVSYRAPVRPAAPDGPGPGPGPGAAAVRSRRRRWVGPEAALAGVVALILVNQVLFNVYVLRVHDGSPAFIARYLPTGWFAMDEGNPWIRLLARHCPVPPALLAPSVLRVQAFLELPLVLLAYASVLRWLDTGVYRRVLRSPLIWCASASYTAAFCSVEWDLRNPYTGWDIAVRLLSAVVTPAAMAALAGREHRESRPLTAARLLLFCVQVGLLGYLVLALYNTALLYNLGLLAGYLPGAVAALLALAGTGVLATGRRSAGQRPGPAVGLLVSALGWFLVLFFVPALAVRYGVNFGSPALALLAGALTALAAGVFAVRERGVTGGLLLRLGAAAVVATAAAGVTDRLLRGGSSYEAGVLGAFVVFLVVAITASALIDGRAGAAGTAGSAATAGTAGPGSAVGP